MIKPDHSAVLLVGNNYIEQNLTAGDGERGRGLRRNAGWIRSSIRGLICSGGLLLCRQLGCKCKSGCGKNRKNGFRKRRQGRHKTHFPL